MWKQKGEEYRVTGYGGWCWVSKTRVQRFVPKLPGNTNVNYRKELEGIFKTFFFFIDSISSPAAVMFGSCSAFFC